MRYVSVIVFVGLWAAAAPADAQDPAPGNGGQTGTVYEKETTYDFENDIVEGQLVRPDGDFVSGQRHGKNSSLIRIRADFIPEVVESVEEL